MRMLVIEDEARTAEYLQQGLSESGFIVDCASTGTDGLHMFRNNIYELVFLDVNLPGMDGWSILAEIRRVSRVKVMMLTGRGRLHEKVRGFDGGADDYLVKPFEFPELLARVKALLRRSDKMSENNTLRVADLELDPGRHRAYRGDTRVNLTTKEFALLQLLMSHSGEVLSRTQIISLIWDVNFDCDANVIEVCIRRLRSKIDDPFENKLIHTLRGIGYVLEDRS
ncbi:TPA: heavy metal response regulator transcription factor [Pseudomonas aeruginosa]